MKFACWCKIESKIHNAESRIENQELEIEIEIEIAIAIEIWKISNGKAVGQMV
jgi:hypothetical protein